MKRKVELVSSARGIAASLGVAILQLEPLGLPGEDTQSLIPMCLLLHYFFRK